MTVMIRNAALALLVLLTLAVPRASAQNEYVIGPQDVIVITVFGEADMSGKYTVEQDGTFTYPQIGRVKAGGQTLRALEADLKKQLSDGFLKNPQVAVSIETYRSQRILIMGEVRNPGEYQLTGDMNLLAALVRAGSTTPAASREATIVRAQKKGAAPGTQPETVLIDLDKLQAGDMSQNVALMDGDTVNIPRAQSVFVAGQVRSPGAYAIERGATVLQVLSLAGGITDRGSNGRIKIQRAGKDKKTNKDIQVEVKAKLSDKVQPGDTIVVGERFF